MTKIDEYQRRINAATNHVANNLDINHSVDQLAEISNFSKFHFHRIYLAITGETVANMVSRLRLESAAATLIYNKNLSITRVASDHGYSSSANFTKAFSRYFGCSPTVYRANSKIGKAKTANFGQDTAIEHQVAICQRPEVLLAYVRSKGPYSQMKIGLMHSEIQQWVEQRDCAADERLSVGITWSDSLITQEENWIYDACVAVQPTTRGAGATGIQTLQAGMVAQLDIELQPNDSHDLSPYWNWLVRDWFLASDYELRSSPSYELYAATQRSFKVRLCLPLESSPRSI